MLNLVLILLIAICFCFALFFFLISSLNICLIKNLAYFFLGFAFNGVTLVHDSINRSERLVRVDFCLSL
jgi:hypothetical protein